MGLNPLEDDANSEKINNIAAGISIAQLDSIEWFNTTTGISIDKLDSIK